MGVSYQFFESNLNSRLQEWGLVYLKKSAKLKDYLVL